MGETFCCETYCFKCEAENRTEDLDIRTRQQNGNYGNPFSHFIPCYNKKRSYGGHIKNKFNRMKKRGELIENWHGICSISLQGRKHTGG